MRQKLFAAVAVFMLAMPAFSSPCDPKWDKLTCRCFHEAQDGANSCIINQCSVKATKASGVPFDECRNICVQTGMAVGGQCLQDGRKKK